MVNLKILIKKTGIQRVLWILFFMIIWECLALLGIWNENIFPSMHGILIALVKELVVGDLLIQVYYSMRIIAISMAVAILIAMVMAYLNIRSKVWYSLFDTLTLLAHPLPGIALMPLVILWVGTGEKAALFIIIHSILWPLAINLTSGFKGIAKVYKDISRNLQLGPFQHFMYILLPASSVYFIAGLRISWSRAWRALISAEMIFGAMNLIGGIGWYYFEKRVFMDTAGMYAGLVIIILIGFLVERYVFQPIELTTTKKWGMQDDAHH